MEERIDNGDTSTVAQTADKLVKRGRSSTTYTQPIPIVQGPNLSRRKIPSTSTAQIPMEESIGNGDTSTVADTTDKPAKRGRKVTSSVQLIVQAQNISRGQRSLPPYRQ